MRFDVLTLFPEIFASYLSQSLLHKAIEKKLIEVELHDLRRWAKDKHRSVDDRPFGGGPGMVLKVDVVVEAVEEIKQHSSESGRLVMLTPQGRRLDQTCIENLATSNRITLLCGRYEGFDQRVVDILQPTEISIGDYVLNGGEVAAMVVIDAVSRMIPGVLGDEQSNIDDSFSSGNRLLEFAQFTRPREYRGHKVPDVLLSGDHQAIARWRREQSYEKTKQRRSDLINKTQDTNPSPLNGEGQAEEES